MTKEQLLEIEQLLKINNREFNRHLLKNLLKDEKKELLPQPKLVRLSHLNRHQKKNLNYLLLYNYNQRLMPFVKILENSKEKICILYCLLSKFPTHQNLNDLCDWLLTVLEISADPLLISFIIRYILKMICKCGKRNSYSFKRRKALISRANTLHFYSA